MIFGLLLSHSTDVMAGTAASVVTLAVAFEDSLSLLLYAETPKVYVVPGVSSVKVYDIVSKETEEIPSSGTDGVLGGHGGGDAGIVKTLYSYMIGEYNGVSVPTIQESCYNHLITFAADHARKTGTVVDVEEYINNLKK